MSYTERPFFGGAITASLPSRLIDVSDLRQVPDTQEVFVYPESNVSFIIEILEKVPLEDGHDAARFHFDSIAHDNDAVEPIIFDVQEVSDDRSDQTPSPFVLRGKQRVRKFNRTTLDEVDILLALLRVPANNIDIVISTNVPLAGSDNAGSLADIQADFDALIRSLRIIDYNLFA